MQFDALAQAQLALETLGQAEVDVHAAGVFQVDEVGAVFDEITQIDVANTHRAVERRDDRHARQTRAGQRQLRLGHLQAGRTFFQHPLRDKVLRHQFLIALEIGQGNRHLRLGLLDLGFLQRVIELHQDLAAFDRTTVHKTQGLHAPGNLGAHHDALAGAQ